MTPYYDQDGIAIYNADCRQVLPFLPQFDLLLTDPPYGNNALNGSRPAQKYNVNRSSNWDCSRVDDETMRNCLEKAKHTIVWGGNNYSHLFRPSKCFLYWDKPYAISMKEMSDGELALTTLGIPARKKICLAERDKVHPTQKPVALIRWCLSLVPEAQTILDPFMGSGTTLLAARLEGRKAVGIEVNETYCKAAVKRLSQGLLFGDMEVTEMAS